MDEVVTHLSRRLQAARNDRRRAHADIQEAQNQGDADDHEQGRLAETQRFAHLSENWVKLELTERVNR
ncbi:hypothetical protein AA0488_0939 [Kozakia baliensis NRIC 0488]|nr:hypothetical protein AA0488_0939 [Kozakia baliensis NRIC 0488]